MDVIITSLGKPMFLIAANSLQCRICIREFNQPPKGQPTMINSCKVRLHYQLLVANKAFFCGPSNISWLLGSPLGVESPNFMLLRLWSKRPSPRQAGGGGRRIGAGGCSTAGGCDGACGGGGWVVTTGGAWVAGGGGWVATGAASVGAGGWVVVAAASVTGAAVAGWVVATAAAGAAGWVVATAAGAAAGAAAGWVVATAGASVAGGRGCVVAMAGVSVAGVAGAAVASCAGGCNSWVLVLSCHPSPSDAGNGSGANGDWKDKATSISLDICMSQMVPNGSWQ